MIRAAIFFVLALAAPAGANAQTLAEASQTNLAVALDVCLDVMVARAVPAQAIPPRGFTYRRVDRPVNQFGVTPGPLHFFDAPGDTARITVDAPSTTAGICSALSDHVGLANASTIAAQVMGGRFPGAWTITPSPQGCPTISLRLGNGLPLIVGIQSGATTGNRCTEIGSSRITLSYPG